MKKVKNYKIHSLPYASTPNMSEIQWVYNLRL